MSDAKGGQIKQNSLLTKYELGNLILGDTDIHCAEARLANSRFNLDQGFGLLSENHTFNLLFFLHLRIVLQTKFSV